VKDELASNWSIILPFAWRDLGKRYPSRNSNRGSPKCKSRTLAFGQTWSVCLSLWRTVWWKVYRQNEKEKDEPFYCGPSSFVTVMPPCHCVGLAASEQKPVSCQAFFLLSEGLQKEILNAHTILVVSAPAGSRLMHRSSL